MSDAGLSAFAARARALVYRIGRGALGDDKRFPSIEYWKGALRSPITFYQLFEDSVGTVQTQRIARPQHDSAILQFLLDGDMDSLQTPVEIGTLTTPRLRIFANYLISRVLLAEMGGTANKNTLRAQARATFAAAAEVDQDPTVIARDKWLAKELLLALALGDYSHVVEKYEPLGYDPRAEEGADRLLLAQCYFLARIALGTSDRPIDVGTDSLAVALCLSYYIGLVNDDTSAELSVQALVLISLLHDKITGRKRSQEEFYRSLAPDEVLAAIRRRHGTDRLVP